MYQIFSSINLFTLIPFSMSLLETSAKLSMSQLEKALIYLHLMWVDIISFTCAYVLHRVVTQKNSLLGTFHVFSTISVSDQLQYKCRILFVSSKKVLLIFVCVSFGPSQIRKEHQKIPLVNKKWLSILLGDRVPMSLGTMLLETFVITSSFKQLNRDLKPKVHSDISKRLR